MPALATKRLASYEREVVARAGASHAFEFPGDIAKVEARVRAARPWKWLERSNDHWGDYVSGHPFVPPHHSTVKIFHDPVEDTFVACCGFAAYSTTDTPLSDRKGQAMVDAARRDLFELLTEVGATNVREVEDYSS
jgi:hypothetical protein